MTRYFKRLADTMDARMSECTDKIGELEQFVRISSENETTVSGLDEDNFEAILRAQYNTLLLMAARLASLQKEILRYKNEFFSART